MQGDKLNEYIRSHYRSFTIRYNRDKEAELVAWLESVGDYKRYITALIRADMGRRKRRKKE